MKVGPLYRALTGSDWAEPILVHTGQHVDAEMSDVFFRDLQLPRPHHHLGASGDTHARQTAAVMTAYETLCVNSRPDWTVVVGDVNSTLAACLAAKKLDIPVAHLEAGLRSGDRTMPEEINRLAVDAISDLLWTPSEDADANLIREGVPAGRIARVGNIMIDAYCLLAGPIEQARIPQKLGLDGRPYAVVTLHRPSHVDGKEPLAEIVAQLDRLSQRLAVVFPVHPRTKRMLVQHELWDRLGGTGVTLLDPLGYIEFMSLVRSSAAVVTDSGGVQEETTYLGIPCFTARDSTERPITVERGTNKLISVPRIATEVLSATNLPRRTSPIPLWDGKTAQRVAESLRLRVARNRR
jgi:UDP-N-acetylglucosamine 2-epimerase (non-hydrolysing)